MKSMGSLPFRLLNTIAISLLLSAPAFGAVQKAVFAGSFPLELEDPGANICFGIANLGVDMADLEKSMEAVIGDVLRGSLVWPNKASPHYFCNDPESNVRSLMRLAREGLLRCHPGVFGSFPGTELGRFLRTDSGEVMEFSGETV